MNVICHYNESSQVEVAKLDSFAQRVHHDFSNGGLTKIQSPRRSQIQMAIDPYESLASGSLRERRKVAMRQTAVKVPGEEQPLSFRIIMR
jgi:hypothetical protein